MGKRVVNPRGETFFQIHQKTCKDFGEFEGFYWHLMYNSLGKVTEWRVLPFENCRLGKPDSNGYIGKILYNPYFGTGDFQIGRDTVYYDVYNPEAVKAQILKDGNKYKGQVLFVGTTNALSRFYPMPEAVSAEEWMKTEAGIADYHNDNINNGLLQPMMLLMRGNPNEPSKNPAFSDVPVEKRKTRGQEFDEVISENFMGAKRVGNLMVQWVDNPDEKPEILPFPGNANGELFNAIDNQATKKITIAFKVPAVLANIHEGVSLGGDGNQIRVAVKLMQQRSIKKQRTLTDNYQKILSNFYQPYNQVLTIAPYNPFPELEVIDEKIWNAMTVEERRTWIEENTEILLFDNPQAAPAQPTQPAIPAATNLIPGEFPERVRKNVKMALEYQEKMQIPCGGRGGKMLAEAILQDSPMGLRQLKRIHSYLKKNSQFANSPYNEGCGAIQYQQWGGKEMFDFLEGKLKTIDKWLNKIN